MTPRRLEPNLERVLTEVVRTAETLVAQSRRMAADHDRMETTNARLQSLVAMLKAENEEDDGG